MRHGFGGCSALLVLIAACSHDVTIADVEHAYCDQALECTSTFPGASVYPGTTFETTHLATSVETCIAEFEHVLQTTQITSALRTGRRAFDLTVAQRCIDQIAKASCATIWEPLMDCTDMFVGKVPSGGPCTTADECADPEQVCVQGAAGGAQVCCTGSC